MYRQEYDRYRNSTYYQWNERNVWVCTCYMDSTNTNEDNYSKYRDSRSSSRKTSISNRTTIPIHYNCRNSNYDEKTMRFPVPDDRVYWDVIYPNYSPIEYTVEKILKNPKADSADPSKIDRFNEIDAKIDRTSFTGKYRVDPMTNRPQNPMGRTGITGRGRLYHWGPNHAGDPVVTRWARDENGQVIYRRSKFDNELKPVLEFVAIRRRDTKQWGLPGGMVDPGESVPSTVKREFQEEATNNEYDQELIEKLFSNGTKIFESYCDDPRNTDNAWLETVAIQFHDETGQLTKHIKLNAGDDAEKVVWCAINRRLDLYGSHKDIIKLIVDRMNAYW